MITYSSSIEHLERFELTGFLAHWDFEPPDGTLFEMLSRSSQIVLARDAESSKLCGYIAALSDGLTCGYISALEVRPEYRRRGIGTELLNRMVERLDVYGIYLSCASEMLPFYQAVGFSAGTSMSKRKRLGERRR